MFAVEVYNEAGYRLDVERLARAVARTLGHLDAPEESGVTIVVGDDEMITDLNRRFRGVAGPTDVLSFPAGGEPYWGDIIIAYPYAATQAEREGHDLNDSLALLAVHGTLHLLGYDHDDTERRAEMWAVQQAILQELGVPLAIVPALESQSDEHETESNF